MKKKLGYWIMICSLGLIACSKENEVNLAGGGTTPVPACDTVNMKYAANVRPILTANCYTCHGNGRADGGVALDNFTMLKSFATAGVLVGTITHASGYSPMPKNRAKLSDCDINKIRSWVNRGALNN